MVRHSGMPYYLAEGFLYVVGALFYAVSIHTILYNREDTNVL